MGLGSTGTIRGVVQVDGTDQSAARLRRVEHALDDLGKRGLDLGNRLRSVGPGVAAGLAAIGATAIALRAVSQAVQRLAREVHQLGMEGGAFSAIARAFERISSDGALRQMQAATGGLVSQQRIMQESVQVLRARILTEEQWTDSLRAVTRLSQDAGENVEQMIQQFAQIASGGGIESLGRLGVNVTAVREAVMQAGLSMERAEGRALAMNLAVEEMNRLIGGTTRTINAPGNYNDAINHATVAWENYKLEVGRVFAEDRRLIESIQAIEEALIAAAPDAETLGEAIAEVTLQAIEFGAQMAELVNPIMEVVGAVRELNRYLRGLASFGMSEAAPGGLLGLVTGRTPEEGSLRARLAEARARGPRRRETLGTEPLWGPTEAGMTGDELFAAELADILGEGPGAPMSSAGQRRQRRRGGGGGRRVEYTLDDMLTDMGLSGQETIFSEIFEAAESELIEVRERIEMDEELRAERAMARLDDMVKAEAERLRLIDAAAQARRLELEIQEEAAEKARRRNEELRQGITSSVATLSNIFGMIADAEEKAGRASDGWRKAQGVALGIYETIKSISVSAEGVREIVLGNYGGGATLIAMGVQHAVAAGIAFSQLAQTGGGGGAQAAKSAGTFRPAQTRPERPRGTAEAGNNINIYTWGRSQAAAGQVIADADWELKRRGPPSRLPRGVGWAA